MADEIDALCVVKCDLEENLHVVGHENQFISFEPRNLDVHKA
jgi:hypothetical protein